MARAWWRRWPPLLLAAATMAAVGALWMAAPPFLAIIESAVYDEHFRLRGPRPAHEQVAIVAIDEASLQAIGRWPWSRTVLADLVRRLHRANVAAIAVDIILAEPEQSGEQQAAARIVRRLRAHSVPAAIRRELDRAAAEADHDAQLAAAIRASGRVVLASQFRLSTGAPARAPEREGAPVKGALGAFRNWAERGLFPPPHADAATFPIPPLLAAAATVGHVNMIPDPDGATRSEALVIESQGYYYPSLALEAVRIAAGLDPFAVKVEFGRAVQVGGVEIPIDARARVLVDYAGPSGTFAHIPAADVLNGRVPADRLRGRLVLLGATAEGTYDLRVTPFAPVFPGVEKHATVAANILDGRFIVRPVWVELVEAAGILALPLLLGLVLPGLRPVGGTVFALAVWAALFAAAHLAFRQGMWIPVVYPSLALVAAFVAITVYRFLTEERQRLWTKRAFQQYVSPEVVERIVADPGALHFGGELRTITVLFSDIRDFTTFAEQHDPQLVVQMLREYLTRMTDIVLREGGTLDKYIGDAVMALFGAPVAHEDHARRACRAALAMAAEAERLGERWAAEGREPFRIGIGVNTGTMVVGNLGSEQLFDYTVIGDEVNLGARLESLNKEYRTTTHIIISEATRQAAGNGIEVQRLGEVTVKGKLRPVVVYELCGLATTPGG